jgi:hypothetical protein
VVGAFLSRCGSDRCCLCMIRRICFGNGLGRVWCGGYICCLIGVHFDCGHGFNLQLLRAVVLFLALCERLCMLLFPYPPYHRNFRSSVDVFGHFSPRRPSRLSVEFPAEFHEGLFGMTVRERRYWMIRSACCLQ